MITYRDWAAIPTARCHAESGRIADKKTGVEPRFHKTSVRPLIVGWSRRILIQDHVTQHIANDLGGDLDQQYLAIDDNSFVAVPHWRQGVAKFIGQYLFRYSGRQRFAASKIFPYPGRQTLLTLAGFSFALARATGFVVGADHLDFVAGKSHLYSGGAAEQVGATGIGY